MMLFLHQDKDNNIPSLVKRESYRSDLDIEHSRSKH
jgi:hypothetical protein